jgi:hypothetical protein
MKIQNKKVEVSQISLIIKDIFKLTSTSNKITTLIVG